MIAFNTNERLKAYPKLIFCSVVDGICVCHTYERPNSKVVVAVTSARAVEIEIKSHFTESL